MVFLMQKSRRLVYNSCKMYAFDLEVLGYLHRYHKYSKVSQRMLFDNISEK